MRRTNTHQHQESSQEPPEISHRVTRIVNEVVWVRTSGADPIGERRDNVSCNDGQRKEVVPDGRGKDDKKESDCEDLDNKWISNSAKPASADTGYIQMKDR